VTIKRKRLLGETASETPAALARSAEYPCLQLALWPTIPAEEAVLRRRATSATRQRTIEANGIDCGASSLGLELRREGTARARASFARMVRVGVKLDALMSTHTRGAERGRERLAGGAFLRVGRAAGGGDQA
jgi:hypothetical protein